MNSDIHYSRNIESFCVACNERKIISGTVGGKLLTIDIATFKIEHELDAHAGMIIAMDRHEELPLVCTLSVDQCMSVWKISQRGIPKRLFEANLRQAVTENEHLSPPSSSVSQAIAFHPKDKAVLVRAANGAVTEITFNGSDYQFNWCRAFFPNTETAYVRYVDDGNSVLVSAACGTMSVFDRFDRENKTFSYRYNHEVIHAAEHISDSQYLLPSDSRRVIRVDLKNNHSPIEGSPFVRDHLERVDYNQRSGRAFASSFDRCIYEICPETCESLGVVLKTPMKCRWLVTLDREPDTLIAQCRNGALYKMSLSARSITGVIKKTPNALWCGLTNLDGSITLAGDGSEVISLHSQKNNSVSGQNQYKTDWVELGYNPGVYTKRMALDLSSGDVLHARTDGQVLRWDGVTISLVIHHPSPLRDIAISVDSMNFWTATEDGCVYRCTMTGDVKASFTSPRAEPVWALAYNSERNLLCVSEREGALSVLDADSLSCLAELQGFRRTKRMRWINNDRLWAVSLSSIREVDFVRNTSTEVIPNQRNTIEDFACSPDGRFVALVTYAQNITLYDLKSLTYMHSISFDMHYPKGIEWIDAGLNTYEFIVWGRSGVARNYGVHDGRIIFLETLNDEFSKMVPEAGVVAYP